ncbi:MAG TPA: prepilin peptidase [Bryobacteraceae bacterium]|nr:prepilin peptidase [Bryobacteraceae bacterium]
MGGAELPGLFVAGAVLLGLLSGSFLNVCIYRTPRDLSVVAPRSFCPECGKPIAWYDNVPVLSFLLLRGRCRNCSQPIGWRYPVVEIVTAVLFALIVLRYGWTGAGLKWLVFEALLVILFFTDLEERLLPDELTIGGAVAGFIFAFFVPVHGAVLDLLLPVQRVTMRSVLNSLFAGLVFSLPIWGFAKLYEKIRRLDTDAMGFGDIKLLAMLGIYLGFDAGLLALLIGSVTGSIFGIVYVVRTRSKLHAASLPFGTFLCLGGALVPLLSAV